MRRELAYLEEMLAEALFQVDQYPKGVWKDRYLREVASFTHLAEQARARIPEEMQP
ncbi:MAG: hypothetical protein M3O78_06415 [Chloroflexota bacterium]|nr:hypothetical protein [Chloroflexota bacterium]